MSETALPFLPDPRLADSAMATTAAWVWSADASQVLWANAAGAALLGVATLRALQERNFERKHAVASQVARLAEMLPADGTARLERLRGLAPGIGRLLTCSCARITLADGTAAILITATEVAGPSLAPAERLRRLLDGFDGAFAAFAPDGALLFAAPTARARLGDATTLAALGAMPLAATALAAGQATGDAAPGRLTLRRIGTGTAAVLIAEFAEAPATVVAPVGADEPADRADPAPSQVDEAIVMPAPEPAPHEAATVTVADEPPQAAPEATTIVVADEPPQAAPEAATVTVTDEPPPAPPEATTIVVAEPLQTAPEATTIMVADEPPQAAPEVESAPAADPEIPAAAETVARLVEPEQEQVASVASTTADTAEPERSAASAPSAPEACEAEPPRKVEAESPPERPAPLPPLPERRNPLRFVWQIDAENRLTVASEDFVALMGPEVAGRLGRPWTEVTAELGLDPTGRLGDALGARDTFSGVGVLWPVQGSHSLPVELSGLPLFDRNRTFSGYRGFGVCRDVARLNAIAAERREAAVVPAPMAPVEPAPIEANATSAEPVGTPALLEASVPRDEASAPVSDAVAAPVDGRASVEPTNGEERAAATADASATADAPELAAPPTNAGTSETTAPEETTPEQASVTEATAVPELPSEPERERTDQMAPALPAGERPLFTVVPPSKNVVPFRTALPVAPDKRPGLTTVERTAFQEIARALGARLEGEPEDAADDGAEARSPEAEDETSEADGDETAKRNPALHRVWPRPIPSAYAAGREPAARPAANGERAVLDRLPVGVLVYRGDELVQANRALLDWTGYEDVEAIAAAGGLERLFAEPGLALLGEPGGSGQRLAITTRRGESLPVECRLFSVAWHDGTALMIVLQRAEAEERARAAEQATNAAEERTRAAQAAQEAAEERVRQAELALRAAQAQTGELESILETATDGVLVVDRDGIILSHNRSVEALFGHNAHEFTNRSFVDLFAPESHRAAQEYLNGLIRNSVLNDGREVIGRVREGGLMPLFMTIGRLADDKFCIVFRDITQWKRSEEDLTNAKREAEKASSAKSDFLAKVSHEIRTPLSAIIGFAEVMMEQRFGPVANDRYLQYMRDIKTSGEHVISLVNDLLDLSKIEAGKLELTFASVSLSDVVNQCVAIMQPQANRDRIIIRTSLMPTLPPVVADERSMRQIVLNLLSNSIKFTGAGGQVIVSTALTDQGEAILRVRDTGIGMSEKEIATAMEPFRQVVSSGRSDMGTGLGLPLTKALAEANRASFAIKSAVDAGTLVEICFPATRVLAE